MASYVEATSPRRAARLRDTGFLVLRLTVTGASFWYVAHQLNLTDISRIAQSFDFGWAGLAVLVLAAQPPMVGLRWRAIVDALADGGERTPRGPMIAISVIATFFGQVLPNVAGDAFRVWLLARLGHSWRLGLASVVIDRGVGVLVLLVLGFIALLLPSAFAGLGGHRVILLDVFGGIIVAAFLGLILVPRVAPVLERFRFTRPIGILARATHRALIGSTAGLWIFGIALAVHLLTILSVWALGRAQGLSLSLVDSAVLFTLMIAITILPISIGGWGLRELAVTAFLQSHGIASEQALFFSVCFGLIVLIACLPGAVVWAVYSPARSQRSLPRHQ